MAHDIRNGILTPRVPKSGGGDMTARRLTSESPHGSLGSQPRSPSIMKEQLSPLPRDTLTSLSKKLVHLSIMLEQDTVLSDTSYPSFQLDSGRKSFRRR